MAIPSARVRLLVCAAMLAQAVGCTWVKNNMGVRSGGGARGTEPLPAAQAGQFVGYWNERATRIQNITYGDVSLRAFENHVPTPQVPCVMSCAQPRNFRLKGDRLGGMIDLGSNSDQFWVYVKSTGDPMFVYCSYADFDSGRAKLPGSMPFEPDWVMQVVGMTALPPGNEYDIKINDKERTYTLGWPAKTPQGQAVRKEIVFDGDAATGHRPQVKRHVVKDAKTGKVVCFADVKRAQTVTAGPGVVQYPTQITLRWEEQKFEMDLSLGDAKLNEPSNPELQARRFAMPRNLGANPINLAEYRFGAR